MTEQPPSASKEALELVSRVRKLEYHPRSANICRHELNPLDAGKAIDALIAQRVAAETERWQERDRQRLEQIERLQETVQQFQSASAERPAPEGPQPDWQKLGHEIAQRFPKAFAEMAKGRRQDLDSPVPSALVSTGEQPAFAGGRSLAECERQYDCNKCGALKGQVCRNKRGVTASEPHQGRIRALLRRAYTGEQPASPAAVAAEHQAAAIRAFGQRVWSDTEEVAYQAGATDKHAALLARLQEPDVIEALARVICISMEEDPDASDTPYEIRGWRLDRSTADAVLTKIVEMLK